MDSSQRPLDAGIEASSPSHAEPMATDTAPTTSDQVEPSDAARSALQTTLNVASTAANLVLFPYVVAGRAAYQATSFAVTAPIKVTKHVANTLSESWQQQPPAQASPEVDLFGEREAASSDGAASGEAESASDEDDAAVVEGVLFESEAPLDSEDSANPPVTATAAEAKPGVVSQLIFLPVRFVSSSVSTAAALPASAIAFGGRTISGAVSSSQSLASSALVASGGLALRTTRHVAHGITLGAFSTAHRVTGLVGSSVRTASYVIPPSVSNALWHGMERTGSISTSVIAYAIAMPTYRMTQALVPEISGLFTEQQLVDVTKDGVTLLTKVLGPQNAFYVLKFMYETVNSEEMYDAFLLCQDLVRESMDAENYKKAGSSVSKATGIETLAPVVKSIFEMMPSLDEMVDAAFVVGEIADEILTQVAKIPASDDEMLVDTGRFEYLLSEDEDDSSIDMGGDESESDESMTLVAESETSASVPVVFAQECFEVEVEAEEEAEPEHEEATPTVMDPDAFSGTSVSEDEGTDEETEEEVIVPGTIDAEAFGSSFAGATATEDPLAEIFNSSVSFFSSVLDSDEASMLLNTFGDFIDVLVE